VLETLGVFAIAFVAILAVELPDKTLVATLVLSTRYRRGPVLVGVAGAFAVQCVIAVTAGGLLHLLPHKVLEVVVGVLFLIGAVLLLREGFGKDEEEAEAAVASAEQLPGRRIAAIAFGVLFAAEWGDASQLATAGLVARYGQPVVVGLAAFIALMLVAWLATVLGVVIQRRLPLHLIQRAAGTLFAVFALIAFASVFR
jgi:putative Ca2+/H+ antiporter (TMEM165/GDT1 family)